MSQKKKRATPDHTVVIDLEMCRIFKKVYAHTKTRQFPVKREIMQIGAVLLDKNGNIEDQFRSFAHPEYGKLESVVKDMTGITKQDLDEAPSLEEVLAEFIQWIPQGSVQAVSWGPDDKKQLKNECLLKHINTDGKLAKLFARWFNLQPKYGSRIGLKSPASLEDAMRISGVEPNGRSHDALNDAMNTAMLYQKFAGKQKLIADRKYVKEKRAEEEERHRQKEEEKKEKTQEHTDNLPDMDI